MKKNSDFTLYSGGHKGAEAEFGLNAEKYGLHEINFSYTGHIMARTKNTKTLSDEELKKGDISMEIIFQHMGRKYTEAEKIRRVVQSIYHMVINSQEVFAIGSINSNRTVKGGTGWGVELAKFFNRRVWVYNQDDDKWYFWEKNDWLSKEAIIEFKNFCGTGTRNLNENSKLAITSLFRRSFAPKPKLTSIK